MKNIVTATFQPGYTTAKVLGLWQYDYGQILRIQGLELPDTIEIHFSLQEKGGESERQVGVTRDGVTEVSIPNSYLENAGTSRDYSIYAFLYISDGKSGNTEYKITMHVQSRPKPKDPETPEDPKKDPFGETVEVVNKAMESARASAEAAAESEKSASESAARAEKSAVKSQKSAEAAAASEQAAATSATAAAQSASQSRESATAAQTAADQAGKSATSAAESANTATQQAENAAQSATNAARSAESAVQSAEAAKTAADTAEKSASAAQQAARSAAESASTATAAAQTATTAAGKAAESATLAGQSAGMASQKATAAETSAGNAAESATEAGKSATAAGDSASAAKTSETAAEEAAQTAQEQAEKIKASAEQIEKNKTDVASLKEEKADKTTLAVTERKLDALWKLNQGISYKFEEDSEAAYQKEVPSGAKLASVKRIGGKTIVWNQLIKNGEGETEITCTNVDDYVSYRADFDIPVVSHKYLVSFECCIERTDVSFLLGLGNYFTGGKLNNISSAWTKISRIVTVTSIEIQHEFFYIYFNAVPRTMEVGDSVKVRNVEVFDLTKMFGTGGEPSTVEEFETMFPDGYYEYNPGELLSAEASEVVEHGTNHIDLSQFAVGHKYYAKFSDETLIVNQTVPDWFNTGIEGYAKSGDVIEYEIKTGSAKNVRLMGETSDGKVADLSDGSTSSEWTKEIVTLKNDICRLHLNWTVGGTFSIRNLRVNGKLYRSNSIYPIPETILQIPGYGWGVGDIYNDVDLENKKYIQRIGHYEFSENTAVRLMKNNSTDLYCAFFASAENVKFNIAVNGILSKNFASKYIGGGTEAEGVCCETPNFLEYKILFKNLGCTKEDDDDTIIAAIKKYMTEIAEEAKYPLVEPIITDVSDLIGNAFQEPFEVESGGTLTFRNSNGNGFKIPVPNTEEYIVSLTEIGGATE